MSENKDEKELKISPEIQLSIFKDAFAAATQLLTEKEDVFSAVMTIRNLREVFQDRWLFLRTGKTDPLDDGAFHTADLNRIGAHFAAVQMFEAHLQVNGEDEGYFYRIYAESLEQIGRIDDAEIAFLQAIKKDRESFSVGQSSLQTYVTEAYIGLAKLLMAQQRSEEAAQIIQEAAVFNAFAYNEQVKHDASCEDCDISERDEMFVALSQKIADLRLANSRLTFAAKPKAVPA